MVLHMTFGQSIIVNFFCYPYLINHQVVYALNTKNDEHDAHISCLQEAHELELKKVSKLSNIKFTAMIL